MRPTRPHQAFAMGLGLSDSTLSTVDSEVADRLRALPDPLAVVRPYLSELQIHVNPADKAAMEVFQTIGLIEELLHGRRQQFGLTRNLHLLKRNSQSQLVTHARDEVPWQTSRDVIIRNEELVIRLLDERWDILEAVDKYLCWSTLAHDDGYRENRIDAYVSNVSGADRAGTERLFDALSEIVRRRCQEASEDIFDILKAVEDKYERKGVMAVADAALNIPCIVPPVTTEVTGPTPPTFEPSSLDLHLRLERAAEVAMDTDDQIVGASPGESGKLSAQTLTPEATGGPALSKSRLEQKITDELNAGRIGFDIQAKNDGCHISEVDLPLLDIPQHQERIEVDHETAPTVHAQSVSTAVMNEGVFGGVVHQRENLNQRDWFVDPLIADIPIDFAEYDVSTIQGVKTYKDLWEHHFVGTELLKQCYQTDTDSSTTTNRRREKFTFTCPLCESTTSRDKCDGTRCACSPLIDELNASELTWCVPSGLYNLRFD